MARSLPIVNSAAPPTPEPARAGQIRLGIGIEVVRVNYDSVGVDVPADVEKVECLLRAKQTA